MISLDVALDRLLHRRSYLDAFLAGRGEALDLGGEDLDALRAIDREQLARAARGVRDDLLKRTHRGCGSIVTLYPRTVDAWRVRHPGDATLHGMADAFFEHPAFEDYREVGFAGVGVSLEEAFYAFADDLDIGDAAEREEEFLSAMARALVTAPRGEFRVPGCFQRVPAGLAAVSTRANPPVLHAALGERYVTGALTTFLAALVAAAEAPDAIAAKHGVSRDALAASQGQLRAMGLSA